jgi:hypothetical protein
MKNQYFGDVNDYRKYGLLRELASDGALRIGFCWMLTPNDTGPDGEKTEYLDDARQDTWRCYDPELYDFLRIKVHGHEDEPSSRDVTNLTVAHIPGGEFYSRILPDSNVDRGEYFKGMWSQFTDSKVDLIFFDPDDGLANNNVSQSPLKKGHRGSAKKLFRDEVQNSLSNGFSVILYQHFDRTSREGLVSRIGVELAGMTAEKQCYSFWTPHVAFFLIPHSRHSKQVKAAVERVRSSAWAQPNSCRTSRKNDKRHIHVGEHGISHGGEA